MVSELDEYTFLIELKLLSIIEFRHIVEWNIKFFSNFFLKSSVSVDLCAIIDHTVEII